MGTYITLIKNNPHKAEAKMWQSVQAVDELLEQIKEAHPDEFRAFIRKQRTILNGPHYDEECAFEDVAKMHHTCKRTGLTATGEHYSIDKAREAFSQYKSELNDADTLYDLYVAINANYHDKECMFNNWFGADADANIIEDAVHFYFTDEDAPEGKVYLYIDAMNG